MATRASGRARVAPVYDEKSLSRGGGSGGPAWAREQEGAAAKENSAPAGAGRRSDGGRKPGGGVGAGDKGKPARKSAPAVAQKGRDAGLERMPIGEEPCGTDWGVQSALCDAGTGQPPLPQPLCRWLLRPAAQLAAPIDAAAAPLPCFLAAEDAKPAAKSAGAARLRSHEQAVPAAAGKQAFPGGPVVKGGACGKPAAAPAAGAAAAAHAGSSKAAAAAAAGASKAAAGAGAAAGGSSKGKPASGSKSGGEGGSNGKRKAVVPPAVEDAVKPEPKPAGKAPAASGAETKRHKAEQLAPPAAQQQQQRASQRGVPATQAGAAARGAAGAAAAAAAAASVPAGDALAALGLQLEPAPSAGADELVEHFSANFRALHVRGCWGGSRHAFIAQP